jgi:selenium-binding protein 1
MSGPGFSTPLEAFNKGQREVLLYIPCICPTKDRPDFLATVDVDPKSETFQTVIFRTHMTNLGDEIHHTGWNACSSCHNDPNRSRNRLIVPGLMSSRIYSVNVGTDPKKPKIDQIIEPDEMYENGLAIPHTSHCLADGDIMISCMARRSGKQRKRWIRFDRY